MEADMSTTIDIPCRDGGEGARLLGVTRFAVGDGGLGLQLTIDGRYAQLDAAGRLALIDALCALGLIPGRQLAALEPDDWGHALAALVAYVTGAGLPPTEVERVRVCRITKQLAEQMPQDSVAWWAGGLV